MGWKGDRGELIFTVPSASTGAGCGTGVVQAAVA